jgi:hypothetical protein
MLLSFSIENDTGKEKCIDIPSKFVDEDQFMNISDSGYDVVLQLADDYLVENNYPNYHIEVIEAHSKIEGHPEGIIWDLSHLNEFGWPKKNSDLA